MPYEAEMKNVYAWPLLLSRQQLEVGGMVSQQGAAPLDPSDAHSLTSFVLASGSPGLVCFKPVFPQCSQKLPNNLMPAHSIMGYEIHFQR